MEDLNRTAFTGNVSPSGAFLKTNAVLNPGTTLQVEFELLERKLILWAQVVWAKRVPAQLAHIVPCGMGVRFINPGPEWADLFEKWSRSKRT